MPDKPTRVIYAQPQDGERVLVCGHAGRIEPRALYWLTVEPPQRVLLNGETLTARHLAFCKSCYRVYAYNYYDGVSRALTWNETRLTLETPPEPPEPPAAA